MKNKEINSPKHMLDIIHHTSLFFSLSNHRDDCHSMLLAKHHLPIQCSPTHIAKTNA